MHLLWLCALHQIEIFDKIAIFVMQITDRLLLFIYTKYVMKYFAYRNPSRNNNDFQIYYRNYLTTALLPCVKRITK